jgi:hypothetical protein
MAQNRRHNWMLLDSEEGGSVFMISPEMKRGSVDDRRSLEGRWS